MIALPPASATGVSLSGSFEGRSPRTQDPLSRGYRTPFSSRQHATASRSHHGTAVRLIAASERGTIDGFIPPTSIATCWYVAHEQEHTDPRPLFDLLADVMRFVSMGRSALRAALQSSETDGLRDGATLLPPGRPAGAPAVSTRNEFDFVSTALTPYHSTDLVEMLGK